MWPRLSLYLGPPLEPAGPHPTGIKPVLLTASPQRWPILQAQSVAQYDTDFSPPSPRHDYRLTCTAITTIFQEINCLTLLAFFFPSCANEYFTGFSFLCLCLCLYFWSIGVSKVPAWGFRCGSGSLIRCKRL